MKKGKKKNKTAPRPEVLKSAARIRRICAALTRVFKAMASNIAMYVLSPSDFTRMSSEEIIKFICLLLNLGAMNMPGEIADFWGTSGKTPTPSTILMRRKKLNLSFFRDLFRNITEALDKIFPAGLIEGYRVLLVDGVETAMPKRTFDVNKPIKRDKGKKYEGACSIIHGDALLDAITKRFLDVSFCLKANANERAAAIRMMKESIIRKALLILDRGYESYLMMAECMEKGWKFLIRAKDKGSNGICSGLRLPDTPEFDITIHMTLCSRRTNEVAEKIRKSPNEYKYINWRKFPFFPANQVKNGDKEVHTYAITFRVVRVCLGDGKYEILLTNLPEDKFPPEKLKELYNMRWRIEIGFRRLKYLGDLARIHSVKEEYILQEAYCKVATYNVSLAIAGTIDFPEEEGQKHEKQVNCAAAYRAARRLIRRQATSPGIADYLLSCPTYKIDGRLFERRHSTRNACPFNARSAG